MNTTRISLRRALMIARTQLPASAQHAATRAVADPIVQEVAALAAASSPTLTVAGYVAHGGELDVGPVLDLLRDRGHSIALPVCGADGAMEFCPFDAGGELAANRYGIGEPTTSPLDISTIDIVLVPGVGFDERGERIGHGVGFYDRFFGRCREIGHDPLRLGIAHDLQIVKLPSPEPWDVPMHRVISPSRVLDTSSCA